eukprot:CCRYP_020255-RA/>CCRYP_020255-RA protein AED:0.12 eAED:0.17 QI:0/0/0/1/0/0/3/0/171
MSLKPKHGLHLTKDGLKGQRDTEGFKVQRPNTLPGHRLAWEWEFKTGVDEGPQCVQGEFKTWTNVGPQGAPPPTIPQKPNGKDIDAPLSLFHREDPSRVLVRPSQVFAFYLMGDAYGEDFGSALWEHSHAWCQVGVHSTHLSSQSSNFREADNLVSQIEELATAGLLLNSE